MAPNVYLLHAPGASDLGTPPRSPELQEAVLTRLEAAADPGTARDLLNLRNRELQSLAERPPLAGVIGQLSNESIGRLRLVFVSTNGVRQIAEALEHAIRLAPDAYGLPINEVHIVECEHLTESHVSTRVAAFLSGRVRPQQDQVVVSWGSGATQVTLGVLDAVVSYTTPRVVCVSRQGDPESVIFNPTAGLPVDPLIPLLRRWRYHDLLADLAQQGQVSATPEQLQLIEAEAEQWGRTYAEPTSARLRAVLAATLMRGDASGYFAVRRYIEHHYRELLADGETDLLAWAKQQNPRQTLGRMLRMIREERAADVRMTEAGRWLTSPTVTAFNRMGANAAHELLAPTTEELAIVREHLREFEQADNPAARPVVGFSPLSLAPSRRVWYLSILGQNAKSEPPVSQALDTALSAKGESDPSLHHYLGQPGGGPLSVGLVVFGTASATRLPAEQLAEQWRRHDLPSFAVTIDDRPTRPLKQTATDLEGTLRNTIDESDVAALVLVPGGPKPLALPLLYACQRVAAEWGVPLYLRQLVDEHHQVPPATFHRLSLRFGTGLALLSAASHALDIGEFDTVARLLGAVSGHRDLAATVMSLAAVMRSDFAGRERWPNDWHGFRHEYRSLIGDRLEVWACLPGLAHDVTTQMRAVVSACACAEVSIARAYRPVSSAQTTPTQNREQKSLARACEQEKEAMKKVLQPLFGVRNKLPVTHGTGSMSVNTLNRLVRAASNNTFASVPELLSGMVTKAREEWGPGRGRPHLPSLVDDVRKELTRRREAERSLRRHR